MKKMLSLFIISIWFVLLTGFNRINVQSTDYIPNGYTPIYTIEDLYGINDNLGGKYILMADIDMSATAPGGDWDTGHGWDPIGDGYFKSFSGILDGNGYRIMNMNIYGDMESNLSVGLFDELHGSVVNIGMDNVCIDISGKVYCGSIAGKCSGAHIERCYATGTINAENAYEVGGLCSVGRVDYGVVSIEDCYSLINIYSNGIIGGIMTNHGSQCDENGKVQNCYSLGSLSGSTNIYPIGNTEGLHYYSTSVQNDYYLSKNGNQSDAKALTEAQMKLEKCYTGFDFDSVWFIDDNSSYPYPQLRRCPQVRIESISVSSPPNKLEYSLKEKLDLTGAKLIIYYEDDYSISVPIELDMCSYSMTKGKQKVIVQYFDKTSSFEIEVGKEPLELMIMAEASELFVGEEFTFDADYNGTEKVQYSSSNTKVLTINKNTGDAYGVKAGTAVVTIKAGDLSKDIEVKVVKEADKSTDEKDSGKKDSTVITEDTVEPDFEMEVGEAFKLAVKKISSKKLSSSDKSVVTISKKGTVKAIAPGTATITIKDKSTKKVVEKYKVVVLSEEEPDFEIETGETMRIAIKSGYTMKSSNEKTLSVGSKGKVTGVKPGIVTVIVYDKSGKEYERYLVEVMK